MQDEPLVFVANMGMSIGRGVVSGLQEALGDLELSASAAAVSTAIGISLSAIDAPVVVAVVAVLNIIAAVIGTIQSLFMIAQSAGGIYSTATGTGTIYDKLEAFAHDFIIMVVGIVTLAGSMIAINASLSSFKSAAQELFGRTSHLTPAEVTETYKGSKLINSFDDFAEYAKGYLDDDALKYAKEVLGNNADDTAQLKKIGQLVEDGSKKIGKKLSKEELKAGLDALWNDGGVEGALGAIERIFKGNPTVRVGQWMSKSEYESFLETGNIPKTNVLRNGKEGYMKQAKIGDYYVEFDVDETLLMLKNEELGWWLVKSKNRMQLKLAEMKGIKLPDPIGQNIEHVFTKLK